MKKRDINAFFRDHARNHVSPTTEERNFVSTVYQSVQDVLGVQNCLQIGSYPRFTAVRPLHDLDVLYILGNWDSAIHDPSQALVDLERSLRASYINPTAHTLVIARQTHSITLKFMDGQNEFFAVDIVPAYISGRNEFGADMYVVPEIAVSSHRDRTRILTEVSQGTHQMQWIKSDPRGYISVAAAVNQNNEDFRRAVKLIKAWRSSCKHMDEDFPLKSFHLEQVMTRIFQRQPGIEIFDAVFNFFCELPDLIRYPQIPDRADPNKNIDAYVQGFTFQQRQQITRARDFFLIGLEEFDGTANCMYALLTAGQRERASDTEAFLFDSRIPMLTEKDFSIVATVLERTGGFRRRLLDALGIIEVNRKIEFRRGHDAPQADLFKWKVKNDNASPKPRGEITDHQTLRDPEETLYNGNHFVECFAIQGGVCIGRTRQNVVLQWAFGR